MKLKNIYSRPTRSHMDKMDGFTLIEVILVLIVLGMLSTIFHLVINLSLNFYNQPEGIVLRDQQAQIAVEYMLKDLKQAQNIEAGNDSIEFDGYYKQNRRDRMKYKMYYSNGQKSLGLNVSSTLPVMSDLKKIAFKKESDLIIVDLTYFDRLGRGRNLYNIVRPGLSN